MSYDEKPLKEVLGDKGYIRGPFGSALRRSELKSAGIPVYEQQHAIYNSREFRFFIDDEKYESLRRFSVMPSDLIISCSGTVGRVSIIRENDPKGIISQALLILRPEVEKVIPEYLYYFFTSPNGFRELINASQGAVQQNIAPRDVVEKIPIPLPDIELQERIVEKLKTIDKKIYLNTQINQTLEQIAQAIFKSWFVDFDPVKAKIAVLDSGGNKEEAERAAMCVISGKDDEVLNRFKKENPKAYTELKQTAALFPAAMQDSELGEIPAGWEINSLIECTLEIRRGISPKYTDKNGVMVINQKCIRNHFIDFSFTKLHDHKKRKIQGREVEIGDVLVNSTGVGTLGRLAPVRYLPEVAVVDSHVTIVRADINKIGKSYLEGLLLEKESLIEQSGSGSTGQTELSKQVIEGLRFVRAKKEILIAFEKMINSISMQIANLHQQLQILSSLRDTLLPKLLSGEIDVSTLPEVPE